MDADLLGSFCMGSNAILHPIKLIGQSCVQFCIQLIKLIG